MAFTRKHYQKTAQLLRTRYTHETGYEARLAIERIAHDLVEMFEDDNPRFDRDRFLVAAFGDQPVKES